MSHFAVQSKLTHSRATILQSHFKNLKKKKNLVLHVQSEKELCL